MRALACLLACAGCLQPTAETCSDGTVCPHGATCDTMYHRCLQPDQIAACNGLADGQACVYELQPGTCRGGACDIFYCGDGYASAQEQCDGTDLGLAKNCLDVGFYDTGTLACSPLCTFDVTGCSGGRCGDGIVNGPELCDGPTNQTCISLGFDAGSVKCDTGCLLSVQDCSRFGWNPESLSDVIAYAVGGASANDEWAVGGNGRAMHYEGAYWNSVPTGVTNNLVGIWAVASDDVWVVGQGSRVLHWNGTQWTIVADVPAGDYVDVWAAAADAVFVATSDIGVIEWNGSAWTTVGTTTGYHPIAIRGAKVADIWLATSEGPLLHWDGSTWTPNSPPGAAIHFMDANAGNDVWVVGNDTTTVSDAVVAHWDGAGWTSWRETQAFYNNVASSAPNDVWVAGADGVMRHYDGVSWAKTTTIGASPSGLAAISGLFSFGSSSVVAVSTLNLAYRYRGQAFGTFPDLGPDPFTAPNNLAFWGAKADDIYVTNVRGEVWHLDANGWSNPLIVANAPTPIAALWGNSADDVWIGDATGEIYNYNGSLWSPLATPVALPIEKLWGSAPGDIWAFGVFGAWHWTSSMWLSYTLSSASVLSVSGTGASDIWLVENVAPAGKLWHWDGAAWTEIQTGASQPLLAVIAVAADDVFVTAKSGRIDHWDGAAWTETIVPAVADLAFVAASARDDVIAASSRDLFHYDGQQWSGIRTPVDFVPNSPDYVPMVAIAATAGRIDMLMERFKVRTLIRTRPIACRAKEDDCNDAVDNDCNGLIDHADPACP